MQDEIRTIVQKRNDHEHRVLAPGSRPADFIAFAHWEQSLDTLRIKRCARLKIPHVTSAHASQARILNIFTRGTERHQGSGAIWRAYLAYAGKIRATKRWRKVMAQALRMRPTDAELWVMAGRRAARNGDMGGARAFFMRGCRFCDGEGLWVEYARCELEWLARIEAKTKGKKGVSPLLGDRVDEGDEIRFDDDEDGDGDEDDSILLPEPSAAQEKTRALTRAAAQTLDQKSPAMDGAIPRAIFDISRKQAFFGPSTAEAFFDLFASSSAASHRAALAQHVLDAMSELYPTHPATSSCYVRQPVVGVDPRKAEFAAGLREVLQRLKGAVEIVEDRRSLAEKIGAWVDGLLAVGELDAGLRTVLEHTKKKVGADLG